MENTIDKQEVSIVDYERMEDARLEYLERCRMIQDYLVSKGRADERER